MRILNWHGIWKDIRLEVRNATYPNKPVERQHPQNEHRQRFRAHRNDDEGEDSIKRVGQLVSSTIVATGAEFHSNRDYY